MATEAVLDKKFQTKHKIAGLLRHPGWKIFEGKIKDLVASEQANIDRFLKQALRANDLEGLNEHIARRSAYDRVLLSAEELKEELEDENSPSSEALNQEQE